MPSYYDIIKMKIFNVNTTHDWLWVYEMAFGHAIFAVSLSAVTCRIITWIAHFAMQLINNPIILLKKSYESWRPKSIEVAMDSGRM